MAEAKKVDEQIVIEQLLSTWQPVAAIATRAGIPAKTALKILQRMAEQGTVKMNRVRIDGHNPVHVFKSIQYTKVFGMTVPVDTSSQEI